MISPKASSIRQQLLNHARSAGEPFHNLLVRYGNERLLFRISESVHCSEFVLKGATLFYVWTGELHRPTKDLDVLHFGSSDPQTICQIFREIITSATVDDGIVFDKESIVATPIRDNDLYGGIRVKLEASLGKARIPIQVDIGIGDDVYPEIQWIIYPTILNSPDLKFRAYQLETAVAEKFEAMVKLGMTNSRMKDYYDIYILARDSPFSGTTLQTAIQRTFQRRGQPLPLTTPIGLTTQFTTDSQIQKQWRAFLNKSKLVAPDLQEITVLLLDFLEPLYVSPTPFDAYWENCRWVME